MDVTGCGHITTITVFLFLGHVLILDLNLQSPPRPRR